MHLVLPVKHSWFGQIGPVAKDRRTGERPFDVSCGKNVDKEKKIRYR